MKKFIVLMIVAAMLAVTLSVASAAYVSYSTTVPDVLVPFHNTTGVDQTVTYNTRPTTGQGGVRVGIYRYAGNNNYVFISGKQFPYFQSVPAMTSTLENNEFRFMIVNPLISGQLVEGNVTYSTSY